MPDWTKSMQQTFEYYIVDPVTWGNKELITTVEHCNLVRDIEDETRGNSSLDSLEDYSDKYIRVYLVTIQNGVKEKFALGTYIYQSPTTSYNGKRNASNQDGYTPLIELKEKNPPLGYCILEGDQILLTASRIAEGQTRAPVVRSVSDDTLTGNFVADVDDTWLSFLTDFVANADNRLDVTPMGNVIFSVNQDTASLTPIWTYTDDNSSILYPDIDVERDLYEVPNVVEVVYSPDGSSDVIPMFARIVNDDPNSITSTISRGREVTYRETSPNLTGNVSQEELDSYAEKLLREKSTLEYKITYRHGYCPVTVGDGVLIDYKRAGLSRVKAKVIRQIIYCENGCPVDETAVFTKPLWQ